MRQERFWIVVVEDNPADAEILRIALAREDAGVEMTHLKSGAAVLQYFGVGDLTVESDASGGCDLIILDLNLPEISGFDVLEQMRATEHLKSIPIIVMSGSGNPEEISHCHRLGATSYIQKSSQLPEIFGIAQRIIAMLKRGAA
jgi:CheY-like chemotaxis protein